MAEITLKGNPINTSGNLPAPGTDAPDFILTKGDLSNVSLADFAGKTKVISIVPSLDTPVCQTSTKRFNSEAASLENTVVLCVSRDLPFAMARFCEAEGIENCIPLSEMRNHEFGASYGIDITDGPLAGILARGIVVLDGDNKVLHSELVPEIAQEPDYDAALAAARG